MKDKSNEELRKEVLKLQNENLALKELSNNHASDYKQLKALYNSQSLLYTSIINSPSEIIIFSLDNNYRYTAFNEKHRKEMRKVWGADIKIGASLLDYMTIHEIRKNAKSSIDKVLSGAGFTEVQFQPNLEIYYEFNWNPIFQENHVVGAIVFIFDITERKKTEKSLINSEERFQLLFNNAPLGYQSLDVDGNFLEVNQTWLDTLGYIREEVVGKWFGDFLSHDYKDGFRKRFPIFKAQGHIHSEFEMIHKNGNKLFIAFEGRVGYGTNGDFKQTHCILQDITERKKMELSLENSKITTERYLNVAAELIMSLDELGNITILNDSGHRLLGYNKNELIGKNWFKTCIPHENSSEVSRVFKKLMSGVVKKLENFENLVLTKSGEVRTIQFYNTVLKDIDGNITGTISSGRDITDRIKAEEELRNSYAFSESLLKTIPFGMDIVDETGTVLFQSDTFKKIFGESGIGEKCWKLYRDDKKQCIDCPLTKGISLGATEIYESQGVLGNRIFDISHTGMLYHGKKAMLEIFQDITDRKQAEKKLLRSDHELKRAQEFTHIGSWYLDVATNEVTWTNELFKMYGFDPTLPVPPYTEHMKLFTPESWELLSSSLAKTTETGVPYELELQTVRKDGSNGWMWVRGEAQTDSEGKIVALWGAAQDISEYKEREERLEEALEKAEESDRLKSAFLANMSHEIRTPMNGILGFAELLKEPHLTVEEQQDFIQTIQISGARMLNTINNIVDVSKLESGMMKVDINETNLNEKIEFTYKFFKPEVESKGLKFLFKNGLPSNEAIINADNEKVYGILTNLIKNAIKFTYEGSIEFGYVLKSESEPGSTEQSRNAELEFYVKDTGVGFPENQKELIFERFRQGSESYDRKYEGSGLGLSISKSYAEMLGGRIWVESHKGKGTTFYFTIPYNPVSEETSTIENVVFTENKEVQIKKLKILIVEDDEISYALLTRVVQKISNEVIHAITGVEAVEACRNNPDFDLVLMDIRMPQMNGLEATQLIRQFNTKVIIIAQTAYGFSSDCEKALNAGCNDYITKPINKTLLFELIKKHIN